MLLGGSQTFSQNKANDMAWQRFRQWTRCFNEGEPSYLTETDYLDMLWEGLNINTLGDEKKSYLKTIMMNSLKETQALIQDFPFMPRIEKTKTDIFREKEKQINFLHRIFDETLAKYKELGFD